MCANQNVAGDKNINMLLILLILTFIKTFIYF